MTIYKEILPTYMFKNIMRKAKKLNMNIIEVNEVPGTDELRSKLKRKTDSFYEITLEHNDDN